MSSPSASDDDVVVAAPARSKSAAPARTDAPKARARTKARAKTGKALAQRPQTERCIKRYNNMLHGKLDDMLVDAEHNEDGSLCRIKAISERGDAVELTTARPHDDATLFRRQVVRKRPAARDDDDDDDNDDEGAAAALGSDSAKRARAGAFATYDEFDDETALVNTPAASSSSAYAGGTPSAAVAAAAATTFRATPAYAEVAAAHNAATPDAALALSESSDVRECDAYLEGAVEQSSGRARPRHRKLSKFQQSLMKRQCTLQTHVGRFDAFYADYGAVQISDDNNNNNNDDDSNEGAIADGAYAAALSATNVTVPSGAAASADDAEQTRFFAALLDRKAYWVERAQAEAGDASATASSSSSSSSMCELDAARCRALAREAYDGRRSCLRADTRQCVGQLYMTHPRGTFAYMEHLSDEEELAFQKSGALPEERRMCEMCERLVVGKLFQLVHRRNHMTPVRLNTHTHACDQPGGYRKSACLQPSPGFSDGLVGTFRHFDTSEYVAVDALVTCRDGSTRTVRGHDEVADVLFC